MEAKQCLKRQEQNFLNVIKDINTDSRSHRNPKKTIEKREREKKATSNRMVKQKQKKSYRKYEI